MKKVKKVLITGLISFCMLILLIGNVVAGAIQPRGFIHCPKCGINVSCYEISHGYESDEVTKPCNDNFQYGYDVWLTYKQDVLYSCSRCNWSKIETEQRWMETHCYGRMIP